MTKKNEAEEKFEQMSMQEQREYTLAELLIRVNSLEKLLIQKDVITKSELISVIKDSVDKVKVEAEKIIEKNKRENN